jgi:hypothetical protein
MAGLEATIDGTFGLRVQKLCNVEISQKRHLARTDKNLLAIFAKALMVNSAKSARYSARIVLSVSFARYIL